MRPAAIALAALVATASSTAAQQVVYTNVVDGQRVNRIVRAERTHQPAAPIPPSITTTEVLPSGYRRPLGPSGYVPPASASLPRWGETRVSRPTPVVQPRFINGIYAGPSPSGHWTSTSIGRPIDVNVIGTPRRPR
jgi:hypothetical protein